MSPVVFVSHRATDLQRTALADACARAQLPCIGWREGDAYVDGPALVVAGLAAGEREIPRDVLALVNDAGDDVPLLLLASEPLVRPSVALQQGRVVVVAEPHAPERLYSHVRMLAAAGERETVRAVFWSAEMSPAAPVLRMDGGALTAVIPFEHPIGDTERVAACELVAREEGSPNLGAGIARILREKAALVHLSADGRRWLVYFAAGGGASWMYSASRLPAVYDLAKAARAADSHLLRLDARSGDVVLALSSPLDASRAELDATMSCGGPVVLQRTRERVRAGTVGLVAEVR